MHKSLQNCPLVHFDIQFQQLPIMLKTSIIIKKINANCKCLAKCPQLSWKTFNTFQITTNFILGFR